MQRKHTRGAGVVRRSVLAGMVALASLGAMVNPPAALAAHPGVVTLTITRMVNLGDEGIEDNLRGEADMYVVAEIAGETFNSKAAHVDGDDNIEPFWTFTKNLPAGSPDFVAVSIEAWDHDDCDGPRCSFSPDPLGGSDDQGDVDPGSGATLDLVLDRNTGTWTGDTSSTCAQGNDTGGGDRRVLVCFDISVTSASGDADGDGLLDGWETRGFDADGNGTIDVNLPAFGANPRHKDVFLEFDWVSGQEPTNAAIQAMKAAFAVAPVNAGGITNPDGLPGIKLWVDTGGLSSGGVLVGDNLGGGNAVADNNMNNLDSNFYATKSANFNAANRRWIFRYGVSGDPADSTSGGQGEIGGNDFIEYNHDGGTIMHEFGHNLNLRHGGFENANCKPSYVSVMNYDLQFGIPQAGGGSIIDYSPPRFAGGRGAAPLPRIVENNLAESLIMDSTDATNRYVFTNGGGNKVQNPLNARPDWNGDGDTNDGPPLTVNVDTNQTGGGPPACANGGSAGTLDGFDDWSVVSLPFRQFGDSADAAINPVIDDEPTLQELQQEQQRLNTTDLAVTSTDSVDPVAAGDPLTYSVTVTNNGPNPAGRTRVVDTLPAGVSRTADTGGCVVAPAGTLTCDLGDLLARDSRTFTITVAVAPDLVYQAGGPTTITNVATVSNQAGTDPVGANNSSSQVTQVVARADLGVAGVQAQSPPVEVIIGQTTTVSVATAVTNAGPSSPMDVRVVRAAAGSTGSSVSPAGASSVETAVAVGQTRMVNDSYTIGCQQPGSHTYTFTAHVSPANAADSDPNGANNDGQAAFTVDCIVPVAVNIKPGDTPNSVNPGSKGVIPLAVLTTTAGEYGLPLAFDATTIDPLSVRFGPRNVVQGGAGATEAHARGHIERSVELDERTRDADADMVLHFGTPESGITAATTEACVKGEFVVGGQRYRFFGCDSVRPVP